MTTFRARFRFRVRTKLNLDCAEHQLKIDGRDVVLSTPQLQIPIKDSECLHMNARGFASEGEAQIFAKRLKSAAEVSSVATRVGIDSGADHVTSGLARHVREQLLAIEGKDVRDSIHGIDVFRDEPNVRFFDMRADLTALKSPEPFFANLDALLHTPDMVSKTTRDVVLLLNYALMRPEPVAQTVFSISAVEILGQQQEWTEPQKQLIRELATNARIATSRSISDVECDEVAAAIERGLHKLSLRQGVFRLLKSLGLESLKKRWDDVYEERSRLVHGLAPRPGAQYYDLASHAVSLCGRILLTFIAREIPLADARVNEFYPPP